MELNLVVDVPSTDKPTVTIARVRSALVREFGNETTVTSDISDEERELGEEEKDRREREKREVKDEVDEYQERIEKVVAGISDDSLGVYKYADADMRMMKKYEIAIEKIEKGISDVQERLAREVNK